MRTQTALDHKHTIPLCLEAWIARGRPDTARWVSAGHGLELASMQSYEVVKISGTQINTKRVQLPTKIIATGQGFTKLQSLHFCPINFRR